MGIQTLQVAHLLLRPCLDHLPRVRLTVAIAEAIFARDVLVAVLEDEDRGLEDLDGVFFVVFALGVIHVSLLACA